MTIYLLDEYMYRRDSPSRAANDQQNLFSYLAPPAASASDPPTATSATRLKQESNAAGLDDAELVEPGLLQIRQILGSSMNETLMIDTLRKCNYDTEATINVLLTTPPPSVPDPLVSALETKIATIEIPPEPKKKQSKPKPPKEVVSSKSKSKPSALPPPPVVLSSQNLAKYERAEAQAQRRALAQAQHTNEDASSKERLNLVVIGHVDAGKSTIMGHLLYRLGRVTQREMHKFEKDSRDCGKSSFAFAWVLDADEEERARGVTMDVGVTHFETKTKQITLLDAPGHRDFIPKMISGTSQADVAILVVPASIGEFEAGFELDGQTKEHTTLARSLGVAQMIVAVNKMDTVEWSQDRFEHIQARLLPFLVSIGFKSDKLWFVPVSGMTGENLSSPVSPSICSWNVTSGSGTTMPRFKTLLETLDEEFHSPARPVADKPFRMSISDVFRSMGCTTVSGRVFTGAIEVGNTVLYMPLREPCVIKAIERNHGESVDVASAGDTVDLRLSNIDEAQMSPSGGSYLCSIVSPIVMVSKFRAHIRTMPNVVVPLLKGTCLSLNIHTLDEPVHISALESTLNREGEVVKLKPRCLTRDTHAVVEITTSRALCLERFADFRHLGRFTLRDRGVTLAAGIVSEIIE